MSFRRVALLVGALGGVARAGLVDDDATPVAKPERRPAVLVAQMASHASSSQVDADAVENGVPVSLIVYVKAYHQTQYLAMLANEAKEFDETWSKYQQRKTEVDDVVSAAGALEKAGKLGEAQKALEAAVTAVKRDAKGKFPRRYDRLDPLDAEVPLLEALLRVAARRKDWPTLVDACALLEIRAQPWEEADERVLFIVASLGDRQFLEGLYNALHEVAHDGAYRMGIAKQRYRDLGKLGLRQISLAEDRATNAGQWVHFRFSPGPIEGNAASEKYHNVGMVNYGCHDTDRVSAYDRRTGRFDYGRTCKQKKVTVDASVAVAFKTPPPQWAREGRDVPVIGKVVKAGPGWQIAEAFVCDYELGFVAPPGRF
jgi:hypothetical protein